MEPNPYLVLTVMLFASLFGLWLATWLFCYRDEDDEQTMKEFQRINEFHAAYLHRLNKKEEVM
jgi:hypothetical protein